MKNKITQSKFYINSSSITDCLLNLGNSSENSKNEKIDKNIPMVPDPPLKLNENNKENVFLHKKRRKFDNIHDYLLMFGLKYHGKR